MSDVTLSPSDVLDERKGKARAWFESLRDRLVAAFETLEDEAPASRTHGFNSKRPGVGP